MSTASPRPSEQQAQALDDAPEWSPEQAEMIVAREPRPDAAEWPGRRLLAAIDAVARPLLWMLLIRQAPEPVGMIGPFVTALAVLLGLGRLRRAVWVNHRYWFTTWRWDRVGAAMLLVGLVLKLSMIP